MFYLIVLALLGFPVLAIAWELFKLAFSAALWIVVIGIFVVMAIVSSSHGNNYQNEHKTKWHNATAQDFNQR